MAKYLINEDTKKVLDNIKHTAQPTQAANIGAGGVTPQVKLLKITSVINDTAAPYKYLASVLDCEFNANGTTGTATITGVELWLSEKAILTTDDDKLYDAIFEITHWRGLKKKDFR